MQIFEAGKLSGSSGKIRVETIFDFMIWLKESTPQMTLELVVRYFVENIDIIPTEINELIFFTL